VPEVVDPIAALAAWAHDHPDAVAIAGPSFSLSSSELWDAARRFGGWLRTLGFAPDEVVATALSPELDSVFLIAMLTIGMPGAVWLRGVEVGPAAPVQRLIALGRPDGVAPERIVVLDAAALERIGRIEPRSTPIAHLPADAVVRVVFSSGTTGAPKGIVATMSQLRQHLSEPGGDVVHLSHGSGSNQRELLQGILARRPYVVVGSPAETVTALAAARTARIAGSPAQLAAFLSAARRSGERLEALRDIQSAGAPLTDGLAASLANWFDAEVSDFLGATETGRFAMRRWMRADGTATGTWSGGATILPGAEVQIVGEDGTELPDGEVGSLRVRTPWMKDYRGSAARDREGWFYPGDLAHRSGGELHLLGRADEVINAAGVKVLPAPIEDAALRRPGIREAVACAVVDRRGVQQIALAVVGEPLDPVAFVASLRTELGAQTPTVVMRLASIPRTPNGKPMRREVARLVQASLGSGIDL
jgi:acyl-coenzyme A synthetase/AMP-(fatty) acid ligase